MKNEKKKNWSDLHIFLVEKYQKNFESTPTLKKAQVLKRAKSVIFQLKDAAVVTQAVEIRIIDSKEPEFLILLGLGLFSYC